MCIYFDIHRFYFNFNRKLKNKNIIILLIFMCHKNIILLLIILISVSNIYYFKHIIIYKIAENVLIQYCINKKI